MKVKSIVLCTVLLIVFAGCEKSGFPAESTAEPTVTEEFPLGDPFAERLPVPTDETAADTPEFYVKLEAENAEIAGGMYISSRRTGFSGTGYAGSIDSIANAETLPPETSNESSDETSGTSASSSEPGEVREGSVTFKTDFESSRHYSISICAAADRPAEITVSANGEIAGMFDIDENRTGRFLKITLAKFFLTSGNTEIKISGGGFDLDYIEIKGNSEEISTPEFAVPDDPCNPNAGDSARALYAFLKEGYGTRTVTGQYVSDPQNRELNLIREATKQYPAIRFGILEKNAETSGELNAVAQWHELGGITGLTWNWNAPGGGGLYSDSFKLSNAVTDKEVAMLRPENIKEKLSAGEISRECAAIIEDIDGIAELLKDLWEADIPVLWRPLHQAGSDWFWWSKADAESYKWLWELVFMRLSFFHELDNLIWVWNGINFDYMPELSMFDIASADLYPESEEDAPAMARSEQEMFTSLSEAVGMGKMLALGECGVLPDIDASFRNRSVWLFFGLWHGEYISDGSGKFSGKYNSEEAFYRVYNSEGTVNLYTLNTAYY
ncbi:MAG: hypothetical protein LBR54_02585 [Oscillospiraceae bacterium]|nr:hypothetical protein [Oscillospiraceae bacterium]